MEKIRRTYIEEPLSFIRGGVVETGIALATPYVDSAIGAVRSARIAINFIYPTKEPLLNKINRIFDNAGILLLYPIGPRRILSQSCKVEVRKTTQLLEKMGVMGDRLHNCPGDGTENMKKFVTLYNSCVLDNTLLIPSNLNDDNTECSVLPIEINKALYINNDITISEIDANNSIKTLLNASFNANFDQNIRRLTEIHNEATIDWVESISKLPGLSSYISLIRFNPIENVRNMQVFAQAILNKENREKIEEKLRKVKTTSFFKRLSQISNAINTDDIMQIVLKKLEYGDKYFFDWVKQLYKKYENKSLTPEQEQSVRDSLDIFRIFEENPRLKLPLSTQKPSQLELILAGKDQQYVETLNSDNMCYICYDLLFDLNDYNVKNAHNALNDIRYWQKVLITEYKTQQNKLIINTDKILMLTKNIKRKLGILEQLDKDNINMDKINSKYTELLRNNRLLNSYLEILPFYKSIMRFIDIRLPK